MKIDIIHVASLNWSISTEVTIDQLYSLLKLVFKSSHIRYSGLKASKSHKNFITLNHILDFIFFNSVPCKVGLAEVIVTSNTPNHNLFANAEHMASFVPAAFPVHAKENMIHSSVPDEHGSKRFLNAYSFPGGKVLNHGTSKSSHKIQVDVPLGRSLAYFFLRWSWRSTPFINWL